MKDRDHPFFRPLWRRIAIVLVCVAWTVWENFYGDQLWFTMAAGMTIYGAYVYLWAYRAPPPAVEEAPPQAVEETDKEKP